MANNVKAFDAAVEITKAAMVNKKSFNKPQGQEVAEFFEAIYKKLAELEKAARNIAY